jgi:hypothetical protein
MVTLPIYDMAGAKIGDYQIDPRSIAPKITKQLLHEAVVMYLANQRQGSNKTVPVTHELARSEAVFVVAVGISTLVSLDRIIIDCLARQFKRLQEWRLPRKLRAIALLWFKV